MSHLNHGKNNSKTPETKALPKLEAVAPPPIAEPLPAPEATTLPEVLEPKAAIVAKKDDGNDKKPFTISLDAKLLRILGIVARSEGSSVSDVVVSAIYGANRRCAPRA